MLLEQIAHLTDRINALKARIAALSNEADLPRQLQTMPGVGPITALAVETFAPPMEQFRRGRDFAAWLGLVPKQHSTGGKQRLGKTSKMGQRDIRRLLVIGGNDERQPPWPVPTTTLAGGAGRKTGMPVWRAAPPA